MILNDLKNSNNQNKSSGTAKNGFKDKSYIEIIEQGKEWRLKKIGEGYCDTPFGLLSPEEIDAAGFKWNFEKEERWSEELKESVLVERGFDSVPSEEYIEEKGEYGRPKGTKYVGPSRKFLAWLNKRKDQDPIEKHIDNEIFNNEESFVEDLPF